MIASWIFWVCVWAMVFTYIGYPILLAILSLFKRRPPSPADPAEWPMLSVLAVGMNEQSRVHAKIKNVLENGYPPDKIEIIICSDGSKDDTNRLVEQYGDPRVHLAASEVNIGVNAAFALGAKKAKGEIMLLTDVGSLYEAGAIQKVVRHFSDPKVGFASGRIVFSTPQESNVSGGYKSYWLIETGVRSLESRLGVMAVTVGVFEVIRKDAYLPVPSEFNNDMIAPLHARSKGYQCRYEPDAVIRATQDKTPSQEYARRVRMAIRGWSSIPFMLKHVPFWRNLPGYLTVMIHKYLRWLSWVFMIGMFAANAFLLSYAFWLVLFCVQCAGYAASVAGWMLAARGIRVKLLIIPFYFCLLQSAAMLAFIQALCGKRVGTWKPAAD